MKLGIREMIKNKIQMLWLFDIIVLSSYFFIISTTTNLNGCILGLNESHSEAFNLFLFGCLISINLWVIFIKNTKNKIARLILNIVFIFIIINISISSIKLYNNKTIAEIITYKRLNNFIDTVNSSENEESIYVSISSNRYNNLDFILMDEFYLTFSEEDKEKYNSKNFFYDGWGTPFNVGYTTNLTGLSESLSNSLNKFSIAVWSSGPNGIDERCLGDDIPWPASSEY